MRKFQLVVLQIMKLTFIADQGWLGSAQHRSLRRYGWNDNLKLVFQNGLFISFSISSLNATPCGLCSRYFLTFANGWSAARHHFSANITNINHTLEFRVCVTHVLSTTFSRHFRNAEIQFEKIGAFNDQSELWIADRRRRLRITLFEPAPIERVMIACEWAMIIAETCVW